MSGFRMAKVMIAGALAGVLFGCAIQKETQVRQKVDTPAQQTGVERTLKDICRQEADALHTMCVAILLVSDGCKQDIRLENPECEKFNDLLQGAAKNEWPDWCKRSGLWVSVPESAPCMERMAKRTSAIARNLKERGP